VTPGGTWIVVKLKILSPDGFNGGLDFEGSNRTVVPGAALAKSRGPSAPVEPVFCAAVKVGHASKNNTNCIIPAAFAKRLRFVTDIGKLL
jgi:hypothetical protein